MVSSFHVEPVGRRSRMNFEPGVQPGYENAWEYHRECEDELELLRQKRFDSSMNDLEHVDGLAALNDLIEGGRCANLQFPSAYVQRAKVEAAVIRRHDPAYMLELRHVPSTRTSTLFGREVRVLRLYYFEPKNHERLLTGVALGSKPGNARDVLGEQDSTIDTAHDRVIEWLAENVNGLEVGS